MSDKKCINIYNQICQSTPLVKSRIASTYFYENIVFKIKGKFKRKYTSAKMIEDQPRMKKISINNIAYHNIIECKLTAFIVGIF